MLPQITIRPAVPEDAPALLAIYAPYVSQTAISLEYDVPSCAEFTERIRSITALYPYLVAEQNGTVIGYAYAAPFHPRMGFHWDVELSIYLSLDCQRHHLGTRLYQTLLALLRHQNVVTAYACATASGNSIAFHESVGFQRVGLFPRSGWKSGSWHDIIWLEYPLRQRVTEPEPLIAFPNLPTALVHELLSMPISIK